MVREKRSLVFWIGIGCLGLGLALLIGSVILMWHPWRRESTLPKPIQEAKKTLQFPLYYPTTVPDGFSTSIGNTAVTEGVLLFNLNYDDKQLAISEQAKPNNVDYNGIVGLDRSATKLLLRIGQATYAAQSDSTKASIITDKTWLIINAPKGLDEDRLKQLMNALRIVE